MVAVCLDEGRRPGCAPGGAPTVLLLRQKKVGKEKATPLPVSPLARWASGAACDARSWGDAEELPALPLRGSSGQTASASQKTMRVSFGTRSPQALRFSARSEGGGSGLHTGHCFARPVAPSLRIGVGSAQREPTPGAAAKQQPCLSPIPTPAGCAEKRRGWGGCVCRRTHALRDLACRCCLSGVHPQGERSEFIGTTPGPSIAGCPLSPDRAKGGRRLGVAFSLVTFSWRRKRKLLRRRAHTPAPALNQGMQHPSKKNRRTGSDPGLQLVHSAMGHSNQTPPAGCKAARQSLLPPVTAFTPAAPTSTVAPTTLAPTFTVVAATLTAASATATTAQPVQHSAKAADASARPVRSAMELAITPAARTGPGPPWCG
jgi:hypothetical protein